MLDNTVMVTQGMVMVTQGMVIVTQIVRGWVMVE